MSYVAGGFARGVVAVATLALLGQACGGRMDNPQSLGVGAASGGSPEFSTGSGIGYIVASGGAIAAGGTVHFVTAPVLASGGSASFLCGNGVLDPGEECDDGNTAAGDGCGATCQIESWDPCPSALCVIKIVCGDGVLGVGEGCDDGNLNDSDGCSQRCKVEPGYYCPVPGQPCLLLGIPPSCGDGIIDSTLGETCDDGQYNGQPGYCPINCGRPGDCGNGLLELWSGEQCDDGLTPVPSCSIFAMTARIATCRL